MSSIEMKKELKIVKHKYHENPKVSVIVPVYKVDKYLTQCLNSIVNQTMEELEIIIVDEGDHDRCREIIDFFEKNDPRIVAPHQKNGGYGASCNLGIEMARGEYLAIVESDDYIEPEMYEEMYEYAKALGADVVKTPYSETFSNGEKRDCNYRKWVSASCPQNICFSVREFSALLSVHASLWSGIYKTSYMHQKNISFITAKGGAYVDVGFRIDTLINTDKVAWLDKPFYNYRIDSEGSTTNNFKIGPMLCRWEEVHKHLSSGIHNEYNEYYGNALIIDEYLNTLGWLSLIDITKDELKQMSQIFEQINEDLVCNSEVLNQTQRHDILQFKRNPVSYYRKKKFLRNLRKIYYSCRPIVQWLSDFTIQRWFVYGTIVFSLLTIMLTNSDLMLPSRFGEIISGVTLLLSLICGSATSINMIVKVLNVTVKHIYCWRNKSI